MKSLCNIWEYGHTYPVIIFDADISPLLNNVFHYVAMAMTGRNMKRSLLKGETILFNVILELTTAETNCLSSISADCQKMIQVYYCE